MNTRYPFLVCVPHGGYSIPPEIKNRMNLKREEILKNSDPCTRRIYNFGDKIEAFVDTEIARVVVDLNRAPYDRPPRNPDGVVKMVSPEGNPVFKKGQFPSDPMVQALLRSYYYPYHDRINEVLDNQHIELAFDCHSMTPFAPPMYPNAGKPRPLVCLSNQGDIRGLPAEDGSPLTCSTEWIRALAYCFEEEFSREGLIAVNDPFPGGFTIRSHYRQKRIPWMQIEINRNMYEADDHCDPDKLEFDRSRILELQGRLFRVLEEFWKEISETRT
jgi:N-formylglutamate deformylase